MIGLIPSQELEERRKAFVPPEADFVHTISICGTKVSHHSTQTHTHTCIFHLNNMVSFLPFFLSRSFFFTDFEEEIEEIIQNKRKC